SGFGKLEVVGGDRSVQPTHFGGWKPQRLAITGAPLSSFHCGHRGSCVNPQYDNGQTFDGRRKNLGLNRSIILSKNEFETESPRLRRIRVSPSLRLAETVSDSPLPRVNQLISFSIYLRRVRRLKTRLLALIKNEEFTTGAQALPKKCKDPRIFSVPCTIGECTFADAILDLGASINVMPTSIYKALNFGDLEPTGMTIQLANRSIVQPLGVLKDVLVQVNEMIFPANFY
ncbi:hypothetical protein CR513_57106, partial [Mucuna pruriens]